MAEDFSYNNEFRYNFLTSRGLTLRGLFKSANNPSIDDAW